MKLQHQASREHSSRSRGAAYGPSGDTEQHEGTKVEYGQREGESTINAVAVAAAICAKRQPPPFLHPRDE
eukprot:3966481-Pleurochrysis_carterae.AAC.1